MTIFLFMLSLLSWASTYDEIDKLSLKCKAGDKKACSELANIAKNNKDWQVCLHAVRGLPSQALLADLAKNAKYAGIRELAVKKISDRGILAERNWSYGGFEPFKGEHFVEKLTDPAFLKILAVIAKKDKVAYVRQAAVEKLADQDLLADIAKHDESGEVRKAAADNLNDAAMAQTVYADIALNDNDWEVRKSAVLKLTDQPVLADIAENDEIGEVCIAAVWKLSDQTLLAAIARNDESWEKREAKVRKLNPVNGFPEGAIDDVDGGFSVIGNIRLICSPENSKNVKNLSIRHAAAEKLTDQTILADIARNVEAPVVRAAAVTKLVDQSVLTDIAKNDKYSCVRSVAVENLSNQMALADSAKNDKEIDVRNAALRRLKELQRK